MRPQVRLPPSFLGMDAWMTLQSNMALIRKLCAALMCLTYFLTCYQSVFVQSDVRSIGQKLHTCIIHLRRGWLQPLYSCTVNANWKTKTHLTIWTLFNTTHSDKFIIQYWKLPILRLWQSVGVASNSILFFVKWFLENYIYKIYLFGWCKMCRN